MLRGAFVALGVLIWFGPVPAHAEAVQFNDLDGAIIDLDIVYARSFRREGEDRVLSNDLRSQIRLAVGPGNAIEQTATSTVTARDGRQISAGTSTATFVLNKPRKGRNGPVVWKFEIGTLTRLQGLVAGAGRLSVTVTRTNGKLTCSVDGAFAREDGVGEIETRSTTKPGVTVHWLDIKQQSASCQVAKR
jgi:hypothetical protein